MPKQRRCVVVRPSEVESSTAEDLDPVQTGIHVATADGTVTSAAPPSPFAATLPGGKSNGLFYFGLNQTRRMIKFSRVLALFSLFVVLFLFLFLRGIKLTANLLPSFWKEKSYQLVQSIALVKVRCTVHFQNVYIVHYGGVFGCRAMVDLARILSLGSSSLDSTMQ